MRNLAKLALAASFAAFALAATPSFAEEIKTDTMASEPMKTDQTSTNTMAASPMAADPMKADCMKKADAEPDAVKKQAMAAECDAMGGGMMKAAPQQ